MGFLKAVLLLSLQDEASGGWRLLLRRYNSVAIGKYTAQGTPRKLYDLEQLQASPSPAKAPRPPLVPGHRRAHSDAPSLPDLSSSLREDLDCSGRQYSADNLPLSANFRDHPAALRSNSASNLKVKSLLEFTVPDLLLPSEQARYSWPILAERIHPARVSPTD